MLRVLRWFAVLWAIGVTVAVMRQPRYTDASVTELHFDGTSTTTVSRKQLPRLITFDMFVFVGFPVIVALLTILPWRQKFRSSADAVCALLATVFVTTSAGNFRLHYIPFLAALLVVATVSLSSEREGESIQSTTA